MKRLFCVVAFFFLLSPTAFSKNIAQRQHKHPRWHQGFAILLNGDTIYCDLQLTRKVSEGLLQIKKGKQIEVLTVKDVASFSYYDETLKRYRHYYTIALRPELSGKDHEVFLEFIYGNNRLSILNHKTLGYSRAFQMSPFRKKTVVNQRYLYDNQSGIILPLSKESLLEILTKEKSLVNSYLRETGSRLKTVEDYISLLEYHASSN